MKSPHILGNFRRPLVLIFALALGATVWHFSQLPMRGVLWGAVGLGIAWVATAEIAIKALMSGTVAVIVAVIAGSLAYLALISAYPNDYGFIFIISFVVGLVLWVVLWVIGYAFLDKSGWIGSPCPHCNVRGKTDSKVAQKDYNGQKTEKIDDKYVIYNLYLVTDRHWCNACGKQWLTTRNTQERA